MGTDGKDLRRSIARNARLLTAAQALSIIPSQVSSLIGSLVVLKLTGNPALAGLVIAVTFAGRVGVPFFSGWLMDKKGRRLVLMVGAVIISSSYLALALNQTSPQVAPFFILFLIYGVGNAIVSQIRIAMTDMYDVSKAGGAIAYLYTASIIGSIATIPIVVLVELSAPAAGLDSFTLLWLAGAVSMIPAMLAIALVKPDPSRIAKIMSRGLGETKGPAGNLELSRLTAPFSASSISWGIMVAMMSLLSLDMNGEGFPLFLIQATITIHVVGMYLPSYPLGRITDSRGPKALMVIGPLITGFGGFLTPLTPNYYLITFGMFLVGVGWCASTISSTASIVAATDPSVRGRVFGLNDVANNVASMALPLAGGAVIGAYGFLGLGVFAFVLSIPASLVSFVRTPRPRLVYVGGELSEKT
ncbi:MAG: MFS transporter [Nitrososphaerales archaeon]|nr:MFS transporter [Nitrososphaerales archaeon]